MNVCRGDNGSRHKVPSQQTAVVMEQYIINLTKWWISRKPSIKTMKATVKRNLNDKLKLSNAEIPAFSYTHKLHRSMCYRSRILIKKFNARGSGYVLEHKFT